MLFALMIGSKFFNTKTTKVKISALYPDYYFRRTVKLSDRPDEINFNFFFKGKLISDFNLKKVRGRKNTYETHSQIFSDKHMNKGLGLLMYSTIFDWAAKQGITVVSYPRRQQSPDAKRLWQSKRIKKRYFIRKYSKADRWVVTPRTDIFRLPHIVSDI